MKYMGSAVHLRKRKSLCSELLLLLLAPLLAHGQAQNSPRPAVTFRTIETQEHNDGNRSIIFKRIAPPQFPTRPKGNEPSVKRTPEEEERNRLREAKDSQPLAFSATVYGRTFTELRWFEGGEQTVAFSNIDFNYFSGPGEIETSTSIYSISMGLGNLPAEAFGEHSNLKNHQTADFTRLSMEKAGYIVVGGATISPRMQAALDAIHLHFDANKKVLIQNFNKRVTDNTERERNLREHPPFLRDSVIQFWPKRSRIYAAGQK